MADKFKNKYRIQSARLQNWDYSWNAPYFITICTHNRQCFFGEITNGKMKLSKIGKIIETEWLKTFEMRPDMNLEMGEFIVMPNHFHAIIIIGENDFNRRCGLQRRDAMHCVSTHADTNHIKNKFGPQSKNLASIIRGFKIGVTKNARKINSDFAWQTRFHDHIIRNDESYKSISEYIINNPSKWDDDKFNPYNKLN
jgi:REP element-mobilizing transposase RayT